jgi:hypothetical protein
MRCSEVLGFNYSGSWGTSGLDLWLYHNQGLMAVEVARGKRYFPKWNVVRWWLSQDAFQRDPERFLGNLEAGLAVFARHDILVMPVLFNRWRDPACDFGGVSLEHIVPGLSNYAQQEDLFAYPLGEQSPREPALIERTHAAYLQGVVGTLANDARIFAWDLCNEPLMGPYVEDPASPLRQGELRWLTWVYRSCKHLGARQPLTIGNYPGKTVLALTEPISDILSFHPYYVWNAPNADKAKWESFLDDCVAFAAAKGKELLASETVWGAVDDAKRVEVLRYTLGALRRRNLGFIVHALQHSLVADLHYPAYGPVSNPEVLHFVNPDGTLRPGHEAWNEFSD